MLRLEYQIIIAIGLDLLLGDPRRLPHPVRWLGWLAERLETLTRAAVSRLASGHRAGCGPVAAGSPTAGGINAQQAAGAVTVILLLLITGGAIFALLKLAALIHPWLADAVGILLIYSSLAMRDLLDHSRAVAAALAAGDLPLARQRAGMMVGRDTANLDEAGVVRATVESTAENLVDGAIAPLLFAVLAGPAGAWLYKAVNTLDSMFGYKNERYLHFGRPAARLDDLVNFLPARFSALLIPVAARLTGLDSRQAWRILKRDRFCHASPNSGHPEAAVAGALKVQLGGPSHYFGQPQSKPTIGDPDTPLTTAHINQTNRLALAAFLLAAALLLLARLLTT